MLNSTIIGCGATAEYCLKCVPTSYVCRIIESSDDELFDLFKRLRWGEGDEVACPVCGVVGKHYFKATRKQWQCKDCSHTFSVTSGTVFAFHKLPLRDCLLAVAWVADGTNPTRLNDMWGVQYKTGFVLVNKIREVVGKLTGFIDIARACAKTTPSPDWRGYWQRGKLQFGMACPVVVVKH